MDLQTLDDLRGHDAIVEKLEHGGSHRAVKVLQRRGRRARTPKPKRVDLLLGDAMHTVRALDRVELGPFDSARLRHRNFKDGGPLTPALASVCRR